MGAIEIVPELSRLECLLLIWKEWMQRDENISHGYPSRACGIVSNNTDFEDIENILDTQLAKIVDTIIQDLDNEARNAINHQYLDVKYRYPIVFYAPTLHRAKRLVQSGIEKRGLW